MTAKIRKRKDRGTWEVDYRDPHGRRRRATAKTRTDAEDILARVIRESRRAAPAKDTEITLQTYAEQWLKDLETDGELAKRTRRAYRYNLATHVLPALGSHRVRDITAGEIKKFLREKRQGYAKNSVRLMRAALSVVLSDCVDDGLLLTNPAIAKGGRRKRHGAMTKKDRTERIRPMSWLQRERFLAAAYEFDGLYGTLFQTMVKTGLRPGEALSLTIDDLDFENRIIRVERAISLGELKDTKTSEARDVDMSPELVESLEEYVSALRHEALSAGWGGSLDGSSQARRTYP